jgi:hypothetical protein
MDVHANEVLGTSNYFKSLKAPLNFPKEPAPTSGTDLPYIVTTRYASSTFTGNVSAT